ncbi:MAG: DnaJ domain-containing protein [Pseudomonadota bacterium]
MFDKTSSKKKVQVSIKLIDGRTLEGNLSCGFNGSLDQVLNSQGQFIEVEEAGSVVFISKQQLISIEPVGKNGSVMPKLEKKVIQNSDWALALGVSPTAGPVEVKEAYHNKVRQYHPDLYASQVPAEIQKYASEMLTRLNKAYEHYQALEKAA